MEEKDGDIFSFKTAIGIAADSIDKLRSCDVYRVLEWFPHIDGLAEWIIEHRPDLKEEVLSCQTELRKS
jgi:hypothetical protein